MNIVVKNIMPPTKIFCFRPLKQFVNQITLLCDGKCQHNAAKTILPQLIVAYLLNRRFWHDLFHSIGHVCGWNYKLQKVLGLEGLNTEICEQVNSFLQCIKYTGSHHILNKEKTAKLLKITTVAVAGHF